MTGELSEIIGLKVPTSDSGPVKSATRVLDLFEFLARWDAERTHSQIAEELGIPKSSLSQLLKTLLTREYLTYVSATKGYTLGRAISELARRIRGASDLVSISGPILKWITAQTGESSALSILKGDRHEVVATAIGPRRLVYRMRLGDSAPLYATSPGKALLASLPMEMRAEYLSKVSFENFRPNTINSLTKLKAQLKEIRATGIAYAVDEYTPGLAGIARPILSASGFPRAAINVAIPMARFNSASRDLCVATLIKGMSSLKHSIVVQSD